MLSNLLRGLLEAALNGIVITIGWVHLLDDYLGNGSLCRASDMRPIEGIFVTRLTPDWTNLPPVNSGAGFVHWYNQNRTSA